MAKIKKVANGEYIGANKYTIKDAGGGKSTVDFAPDSVLTPGTEVGAELLNEMQLNALYTLDTNRVVEGQKEVYVANLEGFTDFTKPDLSFYLKINVNNTNAQTYLRLDTTDYLIKCKINDLTKNSIVACRKVGSEIIVLNNYMQRQDDAIWGGQDGGGLIEDPSVTKEVGKRYIGVDGKAYICLVPSNINNSTNYTPCNTVDNLQKIKEFSIDYVVTNATSFQFDFTKYDFFIVKGNWYGALGTIVGGTSILNVGEHEISGIGLDSNMQQAGFHIKRLSGEDYKPTFGAFKRIGTCDSFSVYGVKIRIV